MWHVPRTSVINTLALFRVKVEEWKEEVRTKFWWGNLMKRDHWEDLCVDGRIY
jgi:hypothetical protein